MSLVLMQKGCHGLSQDKARAARELLRILKEKGAIFLPIAGSSVTDPHPEKKIGAIGAITEFVGVEHPLLGKGLDHIAGHKTRKYGSSNMTFSGPNGFVTFFQNTDNNDCSSFDSLANHLWDFGMLLYPYFQPDYCTLDQVGNDKSTNVRNLELNYVYWRNVFGPRYVQKYGRDFFGRAPGWKVEELPDGGIAYMPEESFVRWICGPTSPIVKEAIAYFRSVFPRIKQHRGAAIELPSEISRMVLIDESGKENVVYDRRKAKNSHKNTRKK